MIKELESLHKIIITFSFWLSLRSLFVKDKKFYSGRIPGSTPDIFSVIPIVRQKQIPFQILSLPLLIGLFLIFPFIFPYLIGDLGSYVPGGLSLSLLFLFFSMAYQSLGSLSSSSISMFRNLRHHLRSEGFFRKVA